MENQELLNVFEEVGFTYGESTIYLALLKIGESKVGPIIKASRISRSKVYDILERLIQKGVVSKMEKNNILFYQALSPHTVLNYLRDKEKKIESERELFQKALPQLTAFLPKQEFNIKVYEGIEGFKAVIERTINEITKDDEYKAMGISKTNETMSRYALKIYQMQKIKHFKARSIFDELGAYKIEERKTKWHEIRILPKGLHTPALFTIYGDVVGIHMGKDDKIVSIVIKNKEIADSLNTNFETMWKISKK